MTKELIIAFISRDRPGVVEQLAAIVSENSGNWLESRMAHLAETFTGVIRINVSEVNADALCDALDALKKDDFEIMVKNTDASAPATSPVINFEIQGPDQKGIVHELSRKIASLGASVEEMETRLDSAPVSGEPLFVADTKVRLPDGLSEDDFRDALENSASSLFVDIAIVEDD